MDQAKPRPGSESGSGGWSGSRFADQKDAQVEPRPDNAYIGMTNNIGAFLHNAARLADLQIQLFTVDVKDFWTKARLGLVAAVVSSVTMLASLPVLLLGGAEFLRQALDISTATARVSLGAGLVVIGGIILWWSVYKLTAAGAMLSRSQEEFKENLEWFRGVLHEYGDDSPSHSSKSGS